MKWLKYYSQYKESVVIDPSLGPVDLMESLNVFHDALLDAVGAKEIDIFTTLHLPLDEYAGKMDLEYLHDNVEFVNSLSSLGLKKSAVQSSEDYETFLSKPCKFMMVYQIDRNELQNPSYIVFQPWEESRSRWSDARLYSVNDDIRKFYDKLTSKTIELVDGDESYIYSASNVNDWILQNPEKENDVYKRIMRKEELQSIISERAPKVSI